MSVVTLLTDFGLADTYVGQVHGAILRECPSATIVDLTHAVGAQDVLAGAFLLWTAVSAFAVGSIHLAIVDPGVGSPRRAIALRSARGDVLIGPDNGLLWPALERLGGPSLCVSLDVPEHASSTFHGRDVFAPMAGRLACGTPLESLGPRIADPMTLTFPLPRDNVGEVLHVDGYGNLITNFSADSLPSRYAVRIGDFRVRPSPYYAAVEPRALLAIIGSAGLLEISAGDASAANLTGATRGTPVKLEPL
jgi:S-adenosyl-L-methionine hydrolase (adenosine-forming)